jgi:hypothetical protein
MGVLGVANGQHNLSRKEVVMKCPNSWCPGTISENYDCKVCGHVLRPDLSAIGRIIARLCVFGAIVALLLHCCGCGATINILSSQSRFVQATGTNTTTLATEGGGGNSNKAALTP